MRCFSSAAARRLTALLPLLAAATCIPGISSAQTITPEFTVGTGSNISYFVIDFKDGSATPSHLFAYRWDLIGGNAPTGQDMVAALDAGSTDFASFFTDFSFGRFYDGFAYKTQSRTRPSDFSQFWGYFVGTTGTTAPTWTGASIGAGDRALVNNSWDGWSFGPDGGVAPTTPNLTAGTAAPEPGSLALMLTACAGSGAGMGIVRRRRQRA